VNNYHKYAIGFDAGVLTEELTGLGFRPLGKTMNPTVHLRACNDQAFFDALFDLAVRTADELTETLQQE
jgi:hypothetical protein